MKKKILLAVLVTVCMSVDAVAGGLLTNSNQSASFLRNPSRDAVIDIDGMYVNPAGVVFMQKGWHFGLTGMNAHQSRDIETTFAPLAMNYEHLGNPTHLYKGNALAPVAPCLQAAYVADRWTAGLNFAFGSGGGNCEYPDAVADLEGAYALLMKSTLGANMDAYSMDSYLKGGVYHYCISLGGAYKVLDNLSVGGGLRGVIVRNNYEGYLRNIQIYNMTATGMLYNPNISGMMQPYYLNLDCTQKGFGLTPYLSIDWKLNDHWNFAAKYEFKTRLRLENETEFAGPAQAQAMLGQFADGTSVADDLPAIITLGAQYTPIQTVRLSAGFHHYFDKQATKYADRQKYVNKGTSECTLGAEWDCLKWLTVSGGWQFTHYDLADEYFSDMNFTMSSHLIGGGFRFHVLPMLSIDLSAMKNFYQTRDVVTTLAGYEMKDHYIRDNYTFGLGVNLNF